MMSLPESVTLANARSVRESAQSALSALARGAALVVDASRLRKFDSGLLTVLLELQRGSKARGILVRLSGLSDDLRERLAQLARAYGMAHVLSAMLLPAPGQEQLAGAA
jgi:ABC-type transporter Mla MlaB component